MTREEALAALVDKLRKRVEGVTIKEGWMKGARPRWCREIDWFREELEAALDLPADAPPEQKAPAAETDGQALRLATWFARTYLEPKRVPTYSIEENARHVAEEVAAVRASTPTLTRKEVGKGLGWTSDKTGVYIPWDDFPKVADRLNAFLAAKIPTEAHGISVICTDGDGIIVQTTKIFPAAPAKGDRLWITPTGKYEDGQFWIVRDREWNTVHGDCRLYLRCQKEA